MSVVIPDGYYFDKVVGNFVDKPVFLSDSARPKTAQIMLQGLRLTFALKGCTAYFFQQLDNFLIDFFVLGKPVRKIIECSAIK